MKSPIAMPVFGLVMALSLSGLPYGSAAAQSSTARETFADDASDGSSQPASDTWITTKVKSELAVTKGVTSSDVSVTTVNGVVTLTGVLADDLAVKKAVAAAKSVKGVKSVDSSGLKAKG